MSSAIRFGNPLLVEDINRVDPILYPLLNKESRTSGGRTLIRLGADEIDLSPAFTLFLLSADPGVALAPALCSRVKIIDFTMTASSLEAQFQSTVLRIEQPEVDEKRLTILSDLDEQQVRLRELEQSLLDEISSMQGSLLDDDSVVRALEQTKAEAEQLEREQTRCKEVMGALKATSDIYYPLYVQRQRCISCLKA